MAGHHVQNAFQYRIHRVVGGLAFFVLGATAMWFTFDNGAEAPAAGSRRDPAVSVNAPSAPAVDVDVPRPVAAQGSRRAAQNLHRPEPGATREGRRRPQAGREQRMPGPAG